jgi:hypothetical protein
MSFLVKQLQTSYECCPLNTAIAITSTSSALYGMMGAKKINQGELATLQGAILLAGVPVSIIVGTKIINENLNNNKQDFGKFKIMGLPAAISVALGVVSWFVPAKKEKPKICHDDDCSSSSSSCSNDDECDLEDSVDHLVKVLEIVKDIRRDPEMIEKLEKLIALDGCTCFEDDLPMLKRCADAGENFNEVAERAIVKALGIAKTAVENALDEADDNKPVRELLKQVEALITANHITAALVKAMEAQDEF